MQDSLISAIIELEWSMFSQVENTGGPASCQSDPGTFAIMRRSQLHAWSKEVQESYLQDLKTANSQGRNLMTEKYARMMASTYPEEYSRIAGMLPPVDTETQRLIEDIVAINVVWKEQLASKYPTLNGKGRPIRSSQDSPYTTSIETYLRGELTTYSPATIRLLHEHTTSQQEKGVNGAEVHLLNMVQEYGYTSLAEAEAEA